MLGKWRFKSSSVFTESFWNESCLFHSWKKCQKLRSDHSFYIICISFCLTKYVPGILFFLSCPVQSECRESLKHCLADTAQSWHGWKTPYKRKGEPNLNISVLDSLTNGIFFPVSSIPIIYDCTYKVWGRIERKMGRKKGRKKKMKKVGKEWSYKGVCAYPKHFFKYIFCDAFCTLQSAISSRVVTGKLWRKVRKTSLKITMNTSAFW